MDVVLERTADNGGGLRQRGEGLAGGVVSAGLQGGLQMHSAVHPERIFAVSDAEGLVVAEGAVGIARLRPVDRKVALTRQREDFLVIVHAIHALALGGRRQQRQWHGCLEDATGLDHVVEQQPGLGLLAKNLEYGHAGPAIGSGVVDEHERHRGEVAARGDVEVVAQGPTLATDHQGVLFIGVVADGGSVVLVVNGTLGHEAIEASGAGVAGEHDLLGIGGVLNRVPTEHGGPCHGVQASTGQGRVATKPPNLQRVGPRDRVDRDDRPSIGRVETTGEGILVGTRVVGAAGPDEAGEIICTAAISDLSRGSQHSLTHIHRPRLEPGRCEGGRQRQAAGGGSPGDQVGDHGFVPVGGHEVGIQPRKHPLEEHLAAAGVPQQGSVGWVGGGEVGVEGQIRLQEGARLLWSILIHQDWCIGRIHGHPGGLGFGRRRHRGSQVVAVVSDVGGPNHRVAGEHPRP